MGRRKIEIHPIADERIRRLTYEKRAEGLLKKAMELSILCDVELVLLVLAPGEQLIRFGSRGVAPELQHYAEMERERVREDRPYCNGDYEKLFMAKRRKRVVTRKRARPVAEFESMSGSSDGDSPQADSPSLSGSESEDSADDDARPSSKATPPKKTRKSPKKKTPLAAGPSPLPSHSLQSTQMAHSLSCADASLAAMRAVERNHGGYGDASGLSVGHANAPYRGGPVYSVPTYAPWATSGDALASSMLSSNGGGVLSPAGPPPPNPYAQRPPGMVVSPSQGMQPNPFALRGPAGGGGVGGVRSMPDAAASYYYSMAPLPNPAVSMANAGAANAAPLSQPTVAGAASSGNSTYASSTSPSSSAALGTSPANPAANEANGVEGGDAAVAAERLRRRQRLQSLQVTIPSVDGSSSGQSATSPGVSADGTLPKSPGMMGLIGQPFVDDMSFYTPQGYPGSNLYLSAQMSPTRSPGLAGQIAMPSYMRHFAMDPRLSQQLTPNNPHSPGIYPQNPAYLSHPAVNQGNPSSHPPDSS